MYSTLILLSMLTVNDEARAKAVLTLAAAASRLRQPAQQPAVFWERLTIQPSPFVPSNCLSDSIITEDTRPCGKGEPPRPATNSAPAVPAVSADTPRRLSLQQAMLAAQRMGKPLVVWVNCEDSVLEAELKDCVHHHAETWQGSAESRVVPQVFHGGWWYTQQDIPYEDIDAARVRGALARIRQRLTTAAPARPAGKTMTFQAARGQNC